MANNKYILLSSDFKIIMGCTLYRIKALKSFGNVRAGDLGGYIEGEKNLSPKQTCWVFNDAKVFGGAFVSADAEIHNFALVFGNTNVYGNARVLDHAKIYESAQLSGYCKIYNNAEIYGTTEVRDTAKVYGFAKIYGRAKVYERADIFDEAKICGDAQIYGGATIYDTASVEGRAKVHGDAEICGDATIVEDSEIFGDALIEGNTTCAAHCKINTGHYKAGYFTDDRTQDPSSRKGVPTTSILKDKLSKGLKDVSKVDWGRRDYTPKEEDSNA